MWQDRPFKEAQEGHAPPPPGPVDRRVKKQWIEIKSGEVYLGDWSMPRRMGPFKKKKIGGVAHTFLPVLPESRIHARIAAR